VTSAQRKSCVMFNVLALDSLEACEASSGVQRRRVESRVQRVKTAKTVKRFKTVGRVQRVQRQRPDFYFACVTVVFSDPRSSTSRTSFCNEKIGIFKLTYFTHNV
jgi:hypothetical protein